jgi:predicted aspartyl protease
VILATVLAFSPSSSASEATIKSASQNEATQVYAAADEHAPAIGTLSAGETVTPIAETQGVGGIRWYLVKSRSGTVGWIRQGDSEQSKKADSFFRGLPSEPSASAVPVPTSSVAATAKNAVVVPVTVSGRAIIVPVTFNGSVTANLLLDTGASMTMISRRLANNLALPAIASGLFSGIGGTVNAQIARVDSIKVGDAEVGAMPVSVHDSARFPRFEGLLGMDFLGHFHLSVDSAKRLLVLTPK